MGAGDLGPGTWGRGLGAGRTQSPRRSLASKVWFSSARNWIAAADWRRHPLAMATKFGLSSPNERRIVSLQRNKSETQLTLAVSPVLTSGYYSESLSQSISSRLPYQLRRRSTPPPAPLTARDESVVIEAGMSFVLGHKTVCSDRPGRLVRSAGVSHHLRPMAAHTMADTNSSALSSAIKEFLGRTDHVMNEWKQIGGGRDGAKRSRSWVRNTTRKSASTRSLSTNNRYLDSSAGCRYSRALSFHSVKSSGSADDDTDNFGSCQDLDDQEVSPSPSLSVPLRPSPSLSVPLRRTEAFSLPE